MRNFLFFLFIPILAFSQVPQGVGYQGVATDAAGFELINQSISIRASVISSSATGTIEWQETHNTFTDTFGLFNLTIGQGTSTGNGAQTSFADISWGSATHFLKIEMDVNGGTNYSLMGTNQIMSVPYALYAENANINYDSIATILSNDPSFNTNSSLNNIITPSDVCLNSARFIQMNHLRNDGVISMDIDTLSNIYTLEVDSSSNLSVVKYDSVLNIVWTLDNLNIREFGEIQYNHNDGMLYLSGRIGTITSGNNCQFSYGSIGTSDTILGYGFISELDPSNGNCNWIKPITIGNRLYNYDFTFNNNYLCVISLNSSDDHWCITTLDLINDSIVGGEVLGTNSGVAGSNGGTEMIFDNFNNLIIKNDLYSHNYIFDGISSFSNCLSNNIWGDCNIYMVTGSPSLFLGNSNNFLSFFVSPNNSYNIYDEAIGTSTTSSNVANFSSDSHSSTKGLCNKTDDGYSIAVPYSVDGFSIWDQLFVKGFNQDSYVFLDFDFNFNITESFNFTPLCLTDNIKYNVSKNGKKCMFFKSYGKICLNGNVYSGENKFLIIL